MFDLLINLYFKDHISNPNAFTHPFKVGDAQGRQLERAKLRVEIAVLSKSNLYADDRLSSN